jgi:hypothetical protein
MKPLLPVSLTITNPILAAFKHVTWIPGLDCSGVLLKFNVQQLTSAMLVIKFVSSHYVELKSIKN